MAVLQKKSFCINFCWKCGRTATKTWDATTSTQRNSTESIQDAPVVLQFYKWLHLQWWWSYAGRPSEVWTNGTNEHVNELIYEKWCLIIRKINIELNISPGTCQAKLTHDHGTRCVVAALVPQLLKQYRQNRTQQHAMHCCNMAKMKPSSFQAYNKWTTSDGTWIWLWTCDDTNAVNGRCRLHLSSRKGGQTSQT